MEAQTLGWIILGIMVVSLTIINATTPDKNQKKKASH